MGDLMTIQGGRIYDILRTYNKQVRYSRGAQSSQSAEEKGLDKVAISPEAKKLSFLSDLLAQVDLDKDKIAYVKDLVKDYDFTNMSEKEMLQFKSEILKMLSDVQ